MPVVQSNVRHNIQLWKFTKIFHGDDNQFFPAENLLQVI